MYSLAVSATCFPEMSLCNCPYSYVTNSSNFQNALHKISLESRPFSLSLFWFPNSEIVGNLWYTEVVGHKNITGYEVLKFICVSNLLLATCSPGDSSHGHLLERKITQRWPELCHCSQCGHKAQMLTGRLFTQEYGKTYLRHDTGMKAFQILHCVKWFLTDFLILCLNLCCLALSYMPIFYCVNMTEAYWSPVLSA